MKLRAEKELHKPKEEKHERAVSKRPIAALLSAVALGAVLCEGCTKCPVADGCSTNEFQITLGEGETKETVSNGARVLITAMTISPIARAQGAVCRTNGGSAHIKLRIDSDPAYEQEFDVSPSLCFSAYQLCTAHVELDASADGEPVIVDGGVPSASCRQRCVAFNDAEVTADVELIADGLYDGDVGSGIPDGGVMSGSCLITNKKVSFTLSLGE